MPLTDIRLRCDQEHFLHWRRHGRDCRHVLAHDDVRLQQPLTYWNNNNNNNYWRTETTTTTTDVLKQQQLTNEHAVISGTTVGSLTGSSQSESSLKARDIWRWRQCWTNLDNIRKNRLPLYLDKIMPHISDEPYHTYFACRRWPCNLRYWWESFATWYGNTNRVNLWSRRTRHCYDRYSCRRICSRRLRSGVRKRQLKIDKFKNGTMRSEATQIRICNW